MKDTTRYNRAFLRQLMALLLPSLCLHCGRFSDEQVHPALCRACLDGLEPLHPGFAEGQILTRLSPCYIDAVWILCRFDDVLRDVIHAIKYQAMPGLAYAVAAGLAQRYAVPPWLPVEVYVVPVPLHASREKQRGYNQSWWIARGLFEGVGEFAPGLLRRGRPTSTQTSLARQQRQDNMRDTFVVPEGEGLTGKDVLLVDDVLTTGATMNACSRELKLAGARRVFGVALASPIEDADF